MNEWQQAKRTPPTTEEVNQAARDENAWLGMRIRAAEHGVTLPESGFDWEYPPGSLVRELAIAGFAAQDFWREVAKALRLDRIVEFLARVMRR